jgi:NAD(P)-dependent dehydrogenase (short-subunit alcohol dehydrogenase family)
LAAKPQAVILRFAGSAARIASLFSIRSIMGSSLFDLAGRVALVTGGSKGIGKAMARGFAEAGAEVIISSRHEEELKAAAADIGRGLKTRVATVGADMTKRDDVRRLADTATAAFGRIDILVNNAGSNQPQLLESIQDADWDRIVELNLSSCMALTRYVVPQMKERRWGRVIFLSSVMGFASLAGRAPYSATKSGILGFCRAVALELGEFGITANCIAPGPILTDLPRSTLTDEQRQVVAKRVPLGRWGDPTELAGPALLLASDAGSYITGAAIVVDGGILARTF